MSKITLVNEYLISGCGRCKFFNTSECKVNLWQKELIALREILQSTTLTEVLKWSAPCYMHKGKNILMLSAFKERVVVSFFKGVLLSDEENILVSPGKNSQSVKFMEFTSVQQIHKLKNKLLAFIKEAIKLEEKGQKVNFNELNKPEIPIELKNLFEHNASLAESFFALTPGRQRSYFIYIDGAKQLKTRLSRAEKCIPKIIAGKGWNEY